MSDYLGEGRFRTLDGLESAVSVRRRIVDATYLTTVVPSMRPPQYHVDEAVDCVPPNDLPIAAKDRDRYVIVGAGKTGIDACLWLLRNGIAPDRLTWIMPRDAWLLDRANIQPGAEFLQRFQTYFTTRLAAIGAADSVEDLFDRLEAGGTLLRLDPAVPPGMYRCATVSQAELSQLRRIEHVVRMGRVESIRSGQITLADGTLGVDGSALYIDCSADGLEKRAATTVFDGDRITLQSLRGCQQVFSAAMIAHVEATYPDDEMRNDLCVPVPHPNTDLDWLTMTIAEHRNQIRWLDDAALMAWLDGARLDLMRGIFAPILQIPKQHVRDKLAGVVKTTLESANDKLHALLREHAYEPNSVAALS
jgi:hypothetical protein